MFFSEINNYFFTHINSSELELRVKDFCTFSRDLFLRLFCYRDTTDNTVPFVKYAKLLVEYTIYFWWKSKDIWIVRCMIYPARVAAGFFSRIFRHFDHRMHEFCIVKSSADLSAVSMRIPDCTHYVWTYWSGFSSAQIVYSHDTSWHYYGSHNSKRSLHMITIKFYKLFGLQNFNLFSSFYALNKRLLTIFLLCVCR